jgi:hypothetical protein
MCSPISHKVLARTKLAPFGSGSITHLSDFQARRTARARNLSRRAQGCQRGRANQRATEFG